METIIKKVNVYDFSELTQSTKDKARENYNYNNDTSYLLSDDLECNLEYLGFEFKDLEFSLGHCQGDGVCFKPVDLNINTLKESNFFKVNEYSKEHIKTVILDLKYVQKYFCYVDIDRVNWHYSHSNTYSFSINEYNLGLDFNNRYYDTLLARLQSALYTYVDFYKDVCGHLKNSGYENIEYYESEENFLETCECNKFKFLESGVLYND